ncbi:MAG: Uma2 family endonuclease [Panacagrimonas sp.]
MFIETLPGKIDFEQYLQDERSRTVRHEYVAGHIYAMAGASKQHNEIAGNLYVALRMHYRSTACRIFQENLLVKIHWLNRTASYYPDVMVCCDTTDNKDEYYCERPCLLVEVLSDTTARTDRNEKLRAYMQIPSLHAYLIVSQQALHVTLYRRDSNWEPVILTEIEETLTLDCGPGHAPLTLSLGQIYESVL